FIEPNHELLKLFHRQYTRCSTTKIHCVNGLTCQFILSDFRFFLNGVHHRRYEFTGSGKMKIAVVAGLFTEWNMDVNPRHVSFWFSGQCGKWFLYLVRCA